MVLAGGARLSRGHVNNLPQVWVHPQLVVGVPQPLLLPQISPHLAPPW